MNPRIYKKHAKRAVELLRSHGEDMEFLPSSEEDGIDYTALGWKRLNRLRRQPARAQAWGRITGIPLHCYRCSYEYDEWDFEVSTDFWLGWHYWAIIVPDDFNGDSDTLPRLTLQQRRHRMSTKAIAPGWRWRGGKAVLRETRNKDKQ